MKLGEAMYKASQASAEGGAAPSDDGGAAKKDDVIDAEFKEVGEDDKKKSA
jgi:molecular chaperone DnaK